MAPNQPGAPAPDVAGLVDHLFRRQAGRLVAALARTLGAERLDLAEDVVQDALVQALRTWPFRGVPDDPAAWLFQVARNRALDAVRRDASLRQKAQDVERRVAGAAAPSPTTVGDDELALLYACCHPAVPREAAVALALKTVAGFSVGEIARAFVVEDATVAQRLVRAKRRLRDAGVAVAIPDRADELAARAPAVLEALYLIFNEGHSASDGDLLVRRELCGEALRLARFVTRHPATESPAAHALVALMLFHAARLPTRATPAGDLVLLADQDRARWDARLTAEAFRHLDRAASGAALTRYHVEAEIASYHAAAPSYEATDWAGVLAAYDVLLSLAPSPVTAVHRAVAAGMAHGPHVALAELTRLADDARAAPVVARYVAFHAARAHWHVRAGDAAGAASAYRQALALPAAEPVRRFLEGRLRAVVNP